MRLLLLPATLALVATPLPTLRADTFTWKDDAGNNNWWSSANWNQDPGSGDYPGQKSGISNFVILDGSKWGSGGTNHFDIDLTTSSSPANFDIDTLTITTDGSTDNWVISDGSVAGSITIDDALNTYLDSSGNATCYGDIHFQDNGSANPTDWRTSGNKFVLHGTLNGSANVSLYSLSNSSNGGGITLKSANPFAGRIRAADNEIDIDHVNALANAEVELASDATLSYIANTNLGGLSGAGPVNLLSRLDVGGNNRSTTYNGTLTGNADLHKEGTGAWTLGASSTRSGTTFIDGGSIVLNHASALQNSPVVIGTANGLDVTTNGIDANLHSLSGTDRFDIGSRTVTLRGNLSSNSTFSGELDDDQNFGTLVINTSGSGKNIFSGTNSGFYGTFKLLGGTLQVFDATQLGVPARPIVFGDGELFVTTISDFTLSKFTSFDTTTSHGRLNVFSSACTMTLDKAIVGGNNTTLEVLGAGTVVFTADSDAFTGTLLANGGSIAPDATAMATANVRLDTDNDLALSAAATTIGSLAGSGDIAFGSGKTLRVGGNNQNTTYTGTISGSGSSALVKQGNSEFVFGGTLNLTQPVQLDDGVLILDGDNFSPIVPSIVSLAGSSLEGNGIIDQAATLAGAISPDDPGVGNAGTIQAASMTLGTTFHCDLVGITNDRLLCDGTFDPTSCKIDFNLLDGAPTEPAYVLVTYGTLAGPFDNLIDLPAGYKLDYAYNDGTGPNHIALVADSTPPEVAITPVGANPTNASTLVYSVVFTEPVTGLAANDFVPSTNVSASNDGDDQHFTVTVTGVTMSSQSGGLHSLNLLTHIVTDDAGNTGPTSFESGNIYVDQIPPTATITAVTSSPTNADTIVFDAIFPEGVQNIDASDFALTSPGSSGSLSVGYLTGFTWRVTASGVSGDGTVALGFDPENDIIDSTNPLGASPANDSVMRDASPPVITLNGDASVVLQVGDPWTDPGATATDAIDGSVSVVTGGDTVSTATPGLFTVTYDATDATGNTAAQVTRSVTVKTAFDFWAAAKDLPPGQDGPGDDADNDGKTNLEEFAFDGEPLSPLANPKRRVSIYDHLGSKFLSLTLPIRSGAVFSGAPALSATVDGITYLAGGSQDLTTFNEAVTIGSAVDSAGLPDPSTGWEYRSFWLSNATDTQPAGFLRMRVTAAP